MNTQPTTDAEAFELVRSNRITTNCWERSHGGRPEQANHPDDASSWCYQNSRTRTAFQDELSGEVHSFYGTWTELVTHLSNMKPTNFVAVLP